MLGGQIATGDINPSRFVTKDGAYTVAQSVADEDAIGISHEGTREAPLPGASELAAKADDPIRVYSDTETCLLEAGAAVADGAYVKPDANGRGITAVATDRYSARIERGASAAGEKMTAYITKGTLPA